MSLDLIHTPLPHEINGALQTAASEIAAHLAARHYEGSVDNAYYRYVELAAYEALSDALIAGEVEDVEAWRGEQELDERVERTL